MTGPPPPKPGGGLSLYADLLDPPTESSASISRAPVVSKAALDVVKEQEAATTKKPIDAALRFQPFQSIRRPQQQKTLKPKASFPKPPPNAPGSTISAPAPPPGPPPAKSTLADWAATEDDEWLYAGGGEKRPRGGKKKKKKNSTAPIETDWDEVYDPSRPTNVDEYLRSDERIREVQEWKALLYRHRSPRKRQSSYSDEDEDRPMMNQFAPPNSYSFAPPPSSPPGASQPDDKTGEDAYVRRLALSQGIAPPPPPPTPGVEPATISRAPVRYTQPEPTPPPPAESEGTGNQPDPMDEDDAPRSNRPGQKGFAARLMSKYGWSQGQGLGADSSGILAPLHVQVEKRKKRPDSEGGGWAGPGGLGKIVEPKINLKNSSSSSSDQGNFGTMSSVIILRHMLDGLGDLQHEIEQGLGQEIGEECGDKYGRVERVYIHVQGLGVYIKFVDTVSALRAVNALDGRVFAGNTIEPRFYDAEAFEKGVYE